MVSDPTRIVHWDEVLRKYVDVTGEYPFPVTPGDSASLDAFGRQRISDQGFRADAMFTYDKLPLLFNEDAAGAGIATHDADLRAVWISTGGLAAGDRMRFLLQTYTPYTPGNSQEIVITGTLNPDGADFTNVRGEIGYGDAANGVGFRYDELGASIFLRSSISGSPVDLIEVHQEEWDNPVNDVDWTKSQIFIIDFQSLAVGRVRFYLDRGGIAVLVHTIENDNLRVGPYWQIATLPPYWSIENLDVANDVCRILAICVTVKSEGAPDQIDLPGFSFTASRAASLKAVSTTLIPVLSLRLKSTFNTLPNHGLAIPIGLQIQANNPLYWVIVKNPTTLTGAAFGSVHADSLCEFDIAATVIAGGRNIASGYAAAGNNRATNSDHGISGRGDISINAAGVSDVLTVAMIRTGTSDSDVGASLNFKEIR